MELYVAPEPTPYAVDLFLGGGITNCPNWQAEALELLKETNLAIANPRREFYASETSAREQIRWEHNALHKSKVVLFWFPEETLCPITLYELGVFSQKKDVRLLVGTHENYARKLDVIEQLSLERPEVVVFHSIEEVIQPLL